MPTPLPRTEAPALTLPLHDGGTYALDQEAPRTFSVIVFYRGLHCPICGRYLKAIEDALPQFDEIGATVVAASMDSEERMRASREKWGLTMLRQAYGLSEATARDWGLYLSTKREGSEEPDLFSEAGLMIVRPDGELFFAQRQSAPFTRPPVEEILYGLKIYLERDWLARGEVA